MEKLHEYQGWGGRFHEWRDDIRDRYTNWREGNPGTVIELVKKAAVDAIQPNVDDEDFSHINRFADTDVYIMHREHHGTLDREC